MSEENIDKKVNELVEKMMSSVPPEFKEKLESFKGMAKEEAANVNKFMLSLREELMKCDNQDDSLIIARVATRVDAITHFYLKLLEEMERHPFFFKLPHNRMLLKKLSDTHIKYKQILTRNEVI